jgi:hypothetical protein
MDVDHGKITLPDGVSYKMMILPRNGDITLNALRKISSMVKSGAKIYGPKPAHSNSGRDVREDSEYQKLANELWGENPKTSGVNSFGKGRVYWGMPLAEAIEQAEIIPDVKMEKGDTKKSMIYFVHRKLSDADIYFLDNHKDEKEDNIFTFASAGKYVQLWNSVTGERFSLPILQSDDKTVSVQLYLHPRESYFVVITDKEEQLPLLSWITSEDKAETIQGEWQVYFNEKSGGVGNITFDHLSDWTSNPHPDIKYYSGTAIYKKTMSVNPGGDRIYLALDNSGFAVQVFVNSQDAGIVWCSPWNVEITRYLKNGENEIEIHAVNSLMNRMIYDASLKESERITYSYPVIVKPDDPLIPSGLKQVQLIRKKSL